MKFFIIGGTGSLGKKLIDRLSSEHDVSIYSRDEMKQWTLKNDLAKNTLIKQPSFFVGDIRDFERVKEVISRVRPDVIIIAAALKQVDTCETSPIESIKTNLLGTQNVIRAVEELTTSTSIKIDKVLFVSTDKSVSPVNVYGMCKALSERIVTSMATVQSSKTKYFCTRYGNVLESRGSVIPLFKYQAEQKECITVTDPNMTRFVMTLNESVDLILTTLEHGKSGQIWVPKIPAMRIGDLAELFSEQSKKPLKYIGLRPGEKQHEDLVNETEAGRTTNVGSYYVIEHACSAITNTKFHYTSCDDVMSKDALKEHLTKLGIFNMSSDDFVGLKIEEIQNR